ncbi:MAG: UPF0271 protein [Gemmatales bacterium]|nr:MAG: UPF0271 protein [Gemmatales bacterium]
MQIDLNCDLGEGCAFDATLIPLITSANISCGFHAGDASTSFAALQLAATHGILAGAHPSFPDRTHFGRREIERSEEQIFYDCVYQIGALAGLAKVAGTALSHVKPHGALYNMACRDDSYARPVVRAAETFDLAVFGLPGSRLQKQAEGRCRFVAEGFADRRYLPDGTLVPRSRPDAFVDDVDQAVQQVDWLIREKGVQTICVHGDNPQAVAFIRALRHALTKGGIAIRPWNRH